MKKATFSLAKINSIERVCRTVSMRSHEELANGFGFGTTEFHVIRPGDSVTSQWIHRFLRQSWLLDRSNQSLSRQAVGQQRVPKEFLSNLPIPLPPLAEQKRIVGVLNEQFAAVERAKKAAEERLEAARALREAFLAALFRDRIRPGTGWKQLRLGDVCTVVTGNTPTLGRSLVVYGLETCLG